VAPRGRLMLVLSFTNRGWQNVAIDAIGDPERLRQFDLAVFSD
jgi:hypothetical protein